MLKKQEGAECLSQPPLTSHPRPRKRSVNSSQFSWLRELFPGSNRPKHLSDVLDQQAPEYVLSRTGTKGWAARW
ncbi:unnamed protein product [Arctogadus glacialis]